MYRWNRSFNIPLPPGLSRAFDTFAVVGGGNLILRVFQGWGIWSPCVKGGEISRVASYHGGRGFRGFSWKRLCLCGQLVTGKGLKQALYRIWRYLNINIFKIGFRLRIYESIKLCLQWNTIPILAIQYNNKKLNRGQLLWPATCVF